MDSVIPSQRRQKTISQTRFEDGSSHRIHGCSGAATPLPGSTGDVKKKEGDGGAWQTRTNEWKTSV